MLTEKDLDLLMQQIQSGEETYLYYVAHMIEPREGLMDEHFFKSSSKFKVIKIQVTDIQNAYFEYLNYVKNPSDYHVETEESYYDYMSKYIHYYTVPNAKESYDNEFNPRMPSIIYGYRRKFRDIVKHEDKEMSDVSPVKVKYTNALYYEGKNSDQVIDALNNGELDWKYIKLDNPEIVDGIEFNYITSNWYILNIKNFPTVEKPLINTQQYCSYFRNLVDAFNFLEQLKA